MPENTASENTTTRYRIGAVCQMTGISQHVLRVWEKRYGVVSPKRGPNQRRLYSDADLQRLSLLKALVDRGHAIGSIAALDDQALNDRLLQSQQRLAARQPGEPPRLVLIGSSFGVVKARCESSDSFRFGGHYPDVASAAAGEADVAVLEWPSLHPDSAAEAGRILEALNLRYLVLVYDFASQAALERLQPDRITALRAPLDPVALEAVIEHRFAHAEPGHEDAGAAPPPARRFSDRQLAHLARQSGALECECPQHLAYIISQLGRFETYSAGCESRNAEDAELHRELYRITARARARMEHALQRVIDVEGLSADPDD